MAKNVSINRKLDLLVPEAGTAIPVPVNVWSRYMERIKTCDQPLDTLTAFGWACIGFAANAIFTALSLPFGVQWSVTDSSSLAKPNWPALIVELTAIELAVTGMAIGITTLVLVHKNRRQGASILQDIAEDMRLLAEQHQPQEPAEPASAKARTAAQTDLGLALRINRRVIPNRRS